MPRVYVTGKEPDPQMIMALADKDERIEELEIALRAALSFVQGRHTDPADGHAQMVIAAMRGALRKPRD